MRMTKLPSMQRVKGFIVMQKWHQHLMSHLGHSGTSENAEFIDKKSIICIRMGHKNQSLRITFLSSLSKPCDAKQWSFGWIFLSYHQTNDCYNMGQWLRWANESKATSSIFLFKMIIKLERTQIDAQHDNDKHKTPTTKWEVHKTTDQQQQCHRLRTDSSLSHPAA